MLPIPANVKLIVGALLAAVIAAGQYLLKLEPSWAWLPPLLGTLLYVDGLLTTPSAAAKKLEEAGRKVVAVVLIVSFAGATAAVYTACDAIKSAADEAKALDKIVEDDVRAGKTDAQIVDDVEAALGASATVQQATAIALDILDTLLASGILARRDVVDHTEYAAVAQARYLTLSAKHPELVRAGAR